MSRRSAPPPAPHFAFVAGALDRADALRDHPETLRGYWPNARVLVIDADGRTRATGGVDGGLLALQGQALFPVPEHADAQAIFLGMAGDQAWFALHADALGAAEAEARAAWDAAQSIDLRAAAAVWPAADATAFAQARAVLHWRARHRHCPSCAAALRYIRGGWLGHCDGCGLDHYPRTDPAVIVAITDGERLLLGRQASWPARRYSTLAGFVEPGETLEQAIAREVMEESGVRVRRSRYLGSQPWPFPSSLMLGFVAEAEPDAPRPDQELEDVRWFHRDEVGAALRGETVDAGLLLSPSVSISRWLIEAWYAGVAVDG